MRTDFIRIYKSVHTWTGIISGMALFIAFYAGSLTVFKEPLERWVAPPAASQPVSIADAQTLIVETLRAKPDVAKDFTLHLKETENVPARLGWHVRDPNSDDHDESSMRHYVATLDGGGAAVIEEDHPSQLGTFIDVLHRVVGLPVDSDANRWVMGVVACLYSLALVSGVVVLLPTLVSDFFALRIGKNLKRMWLDAHNVVGIVSLPFHIVMALTATVFAFHDGIYDVQRWMMHEGKLTFQAPPAPTGPNGANGAKDGNGAPKAARDPADMLAPMDIVARITEQAPGFVPTMLQYQRVTSPRPVVRVWGKDSSAVHPRARGGFAAVDPYTGKVMTADYLPGRQDVPNAFISSFFALHMAAFGGSAVQWLYFVMGLAGAWLFYSGNLLWVESRRRRASRQHPGAPVQRLDTRLMAAASVGVCLGCVCGVSLTIVAGKWLYGHVADLNAWHQGLYYTVFFASIAWAFARGAGRAAIHLLWAAGALTLAIPLTSCIGLALPGSGLWTHTSAASLGVDATAVLMALAFFWMVRATTRRVRHGAEDSVWSAPAVAEKADQGSAAVESEARIAAR